MKLNVHAIRLEMARKGITQNNLAEKLGVSKQMVGSIFCRGRCHPINAGKIAAGLGVDVSEIVKEE